MVSGIGQWMQTFAVSWMLADLAVREGDPQRASLYLGILGFATAVPTFILTPLAGALADRMDQRAILLASQVGSATFSVLLAALTLAGNTSVLPVTLIVGALSGLRAFDYPVRWTMIGRIVPVRDQVSAIGLLSVSFNVPQVVGPAVGGLLISSIGAGGSLVVAAATFAAVIAALLLMAPIPALPRERKGTVLGDVGDGIAFVIRDPVIRSVGAITVAVAFLARPVGMLLPALGVSVLNVGVTELSWLVSSAGLGGFVGGVIVANLGGLQRRGLAFLGVAAGTGLSVSLLGTQVGLTPALVVTFVFGIAAMLFSGLSNTVFQLLSPDVMRGRVLSLYTMVFMGFIPLGTMLLGASGALFGLERTFIVAGVIVVAAAGYGLLHRPQIRELRAVVAPMNS
jgi:predicted MFS family arabinose efflux permease